MLSEWTNTINPRHPSQANCPGTTQAQGKVLPIHMTQLHLAYAKRRGKTPTSMFVHPDISFPAKALWQNRCKQVCSPCYFIPGKGIVAKQVQARVLTLPFHPRRPCARQHGQQWGPSPSSHGAQLAATQLGTPDSAPPTQPMLQGI